MERLMEKAETAQSALNTLLELVGQENVAVIPRDAAIQRFEYTFEAIWKLAKLYLIECEGIEAASPKSTIRACFKVGLISEENAGLGLQMVDDRNLTSHTYHAGLAESIYQRLDRYAALMKELLAGIITKIES